MGPIQHRTIEVAGIRTFYREAGPVGAPTVLLPHGYPCSSFEFRQLMPELADRWRLVAPDLPGFGYSDTPGRAAFSYTFAGYAEWLGQFVSTVGLDRYAIYLHDYGSQFSLELAMAAPERVTALIIQNGDIYEDQHGPKYAALKRYWKDPTPEGRRQLAGAVSEAGFADEFVGEIDAKVAERVPPDLWKLHWPLMNTPERRENVVGLFHGQARTIDRFPLQQAYLREHQPPAVIVWGTRDGYMPASAARAYLRDLPTAKLHLFDDGGHWLLETHLTEVVPILRDFLSAAIPD